MKSSKSSSNSSIYKGNDELVETMRAILGSETPEMDIIRALHLAKNDITVAANIILDSRCSRPSNIYFSRTQSTNSNARPPLRSSVSFSPSRTQPCPNLSSETSTLIENRANGATSASGRHDWRELGSADVIGFSTCRGRKLTAGEPLEFSFPRQVPVKSGPNNKLLGRGKSSPAASCSEIVRFSTKESGEIGRIPAEWARCLIPLVNSGKIKAEGHCKLAASDIGFMDNIHLSIRLFINQSMLCNFTQNSSKLIRPSTDDTVFHPFPILFKLVGREPFKKAEFTPDDLYTRKRSIDTKGISAVPSPLLPPEKRRKISDMSKLEQEGEECLSDMDLNQIVGTSESCDLEELEPPLTLQCELRPYQKQALNWMTNLEKGAEREAAARTLHPCWNAYQLADERGGAIYVNAFSGDVTTEFPSALQLARGGILADAMGLGKTVMTIALLLSNTGKGGLSSPVTMGNPSDDTCKDNVNDSLDIGAVLQSSQVPLKPPAVNFTKKSCDGIHKGGRNLIVCPMTLLGQWKNEIETHAQPGALSVYVYYGQSRSRDVQSLLQHDVVLTTYGVVASEYQSENSQDEGVLHSIHWFRVVLDEAHTIKSPKSQTSLAAYALVADCRWCLTGTPIQNNLEDAYSLLRFLRIEPWSNWGWWYKLVQRPFEEGDNRGLSLVKAILQPLMLRRTKDSTDKEGRPILVLPSTDVQVVYCELTESERDFYDALYKKSKVKFDQFVEQGKVLHNYASILELLLRLRQCCDHPFLVMSRGDTHDYSDLNKLAKRFLKQGKPSANADSGSTPSKAYIQEIVEEFRRGEKGECPICLEAVEDAVLTPCAHCMCRECLLASWHNSSSGSCPLCRMGMTRQELITAPRENRFHVDVEKNWIESTKVSVLLQQLEELRPSGSKSIVFSQWTAFLDLLQIPLSRKNFQFVRLDGTMNQQQRERVIHEFSKDPRILVMLISLKSGGVGINLTAASNAFLLDPWWNPAVEEQAIMRIHRIGQTKRVLIKRFIVKGSVEERMQQVQARKQRMISGALTDDEVRSARIEELKMLFR